MKDKKRIALSKRMSYILRHHPESHGVTLDPAGWVDLIALSGVMGVLQQDLIEVADNCEKRRFEIDGGKIRAAQGHSIDVDLGLEPIIPPAYLYHGTGAQHVTKIESEGITSQQRQHVHLSEGHSTAVKVGARHGKPVVLTVFAGAMHLEGMRLYQASNGVWLTEYVPPGFFTSKALD